MNLSKSFNDSEDSFPVPEEIKRFYGQFGFPTPLPPGRPYVSSNFVIGIDGRASFRELPGRAGGKEVSRSEADKWLFNFLLAHHDASIVGADTLRSEAGQGGLGWDLHIEPKELADYRRNITGSDKQLVIVMSGSGRLNLDYRVFNSDKVEAWIATSSLGAKALQPQMERRKKKLRLLVLGQSAKIDLGELFRVLRQDYGIKTMHCLGGPALHGQIIEDGLLDEAFLTISTQILGRSTKPDIERPTAFGKLSFWPEAAPWFKIISLHYELPYHLILRLRFEGPRKFED